MPTTVNATQIPTITIMTKLSERPDIVKWVCTGGLACSGINLISSLKCTKCDKERGYYDNAVSNKNKVVGHFTGMHEVELKEVNGNTDIDKASPATSASWED